MRGATLFKADAVRTSLCISVPSAHVTDLPIVLYDVPSRSATEISDDTVARLFDAELIVGLKDATADAVAPDAAARTMRQWLPPMERR